MSLVLQQLLQLCHKAPRLWNPISLHSSTSAALAAEHFQSWAREHQEGSEGVSQCPAYHNSKPSSVPSELLLHAWAASQGKSCPKLHNTELLVLHPNSLSINLHTLPLPQAPQQSSCWNTTQTLPIPCSWFSGEAECCSNSCSAFGHLSQRGKLTNRTKQWECRGRCIGGQRGAQKKNCSKEPRERRGRERVSFRGRGRKWLSSSSGEAFLMLLISAMSKAPLQLKMSFFKLLQNKAVPIQPPELLLCPWVSSSFTAAKHCCTASSSQSPLFIHRYKNTPTIPHFHIYLQLPSVFLQH